MRNLLSMVMLLIVLAALYQLSFESEGGTLDALRRFEDAFVERMRHLEP